MLSLGLVRQSAGARRKMTDRNAEAGFVGKFLQFELPNPQPLSIASSAGVGRNQIGSPSDKAAFLQSATILEWKPRQKLRCRDRFPRLTKPALRPDVVNAIGIGAGNFRTGKSCPCTKRLAVYSSSLAGIGVVAEEFFLLVSTEITGNPWARALFTAAAMCLNCASRSGWSAPSWVLRLLWRL